MYTVPMNNTLLFTFLGIILIISSGFLFVNRNKPSEEALTLANLQNQSEVMEPVALSSSTQDIASSSTKMEVTQDTAVGKNNTTPATVPSEKLALLADGCFWCVEHDLEEVVGVTKVVSGYAGGTTQNPTYGDYITGGHREVVLVTYDPSKVTYANLVEHIIKHGDPTDVGGSFHDRGPQYTPAIYYQTEAEKVEAKRVIATIDALKVFPNPLPLLVIPTVKFWPAEEYHQDYAKKNALKYGYYRTGSGRTAFIEKTWGDRLATFEVKPATVSTPTSIIKK